MATRISKAPDAPPPHAICNATAIRQAARRATQFYDGVLEPSGLRSTQFAILSHVIRAAPAALAIGELADALVLDRSALGHNLRPLLREKLLRLRPAPEDRRRSTIVATSLGRTRYDRARELWAVAQGRFEATVGKIEAADLRDLMSRIARSAFAP